MISRQALIAFALWALAAPAQAQVVPQPGPPIPTACAYNTTPPTLTDGQAGWAQCDSAGSQIVVAGSSSNAAAAASQIATAALASNLVVKNAAGNLYSFTVQADSTLYAAIWYIMVFDATALPSNGAVTPAKCYTMPASTANFSTAFPTPVRHTTGIVIGVSTTGCFSLTASVHAFISGDYK